MHYFYNLSSASGDKGAQTPTWALSLNPLGYFRPQTPNLPMTHFSLEEGRRSANRIHRQAFAPVTLTLAQKP